jgi:hypothetical protein
LAATSPSGFAQNPNPEASELLQVISPVPLATGNVDGYTVTRAGRVFIPVTFTQPVDPATVVIGKTVLLYFPTDPQADANLVWSADKRVLNITTRKTFDQLAANGGDARFTLTLKGSGLRPWGRGGPVIKSLKGHMLDGNRDGREGDDYKIFFSRPG